MVQIENVFGAYALNRPDIPISEHESYMTKLKEQFIDSGFDDPFFTFDWKFKGGTVSGVLPTANGITDIQMLQNSINMYNGNNGPYMVAEFYPDGLPTGTNRVLIRTLQILQGKPKLIYKMISLLIFMWCMEERTLLLVMVRIK